ncbi:MAG TPA: HIT family protein [Chryseolinea sp.]|nr:HIT family protein [Chryseolinea sp.]
MPSIFTRIIRREIPAHIVAEDDQCIAFLDINPLVLGHTLVVPKKEVDYIFELDDSTLTVLHLFAKKVALAIGQVVPCTRIGVSVVGLEVPHTHVHLIPMNSADDLNFTRPKLKPTQDELKVVADRIRAAFVG